MFAKLLRAVEVAAREGGANIEGNMTLASAVEKARDNSVPVGQHRARDQARDRRGEGGARFEDVSYEGYGPGGVAFLVHALTDNRNRTGQEVRHAFTRGGGNLADPGSVAWQFDRRGLIVLDKATVAGRGPAPRGHPRGRRRRPARRRRAVGDRDRGRTRWRRCAGALREAGIQFALRRAHDDPAERGPGGRRQGRAGPSALEALEDLDDVQAVYANFDIPEEILATSADAPVGG